MNQTEAAQIRASISSVLSSQPGTKLSTEEVATAIGQSARSAGQMLGGMARGKLINGPFKVKGVKGKHWAWPTTEAPPTTSAPSRKAHPAREVELEAFGITIIVGRNEQTGRLRITLEG